MPTAHELVEQVAHGDESRGDWDNGRAAGRSLDSSGPVERLHGTAEASQDLLRELGADLAIDYRATKFEDVVGAVDVVLDTVGGDTQARSIGIVKAGGIIVSIVAPPDPEALAARGIRGTRLIVHPDAAALVQLGALIDAKKLTAVVSQVFALAEAALAHTAIASGHTRGKIVLRVEPRGAH